MSEETFPKYSIKKAEKIQRNNVLFFEFIDKPSQKNRQKDIDTAVTFYNRGNNKEAFDKFVELEKLANEKEKYTKKVEEESLLPNYLTEDDPK